MILEDFIVGVDGDEVEDGSDLLRLLRARRPGDSVRVEIVRGTQRRVVPVTLGEAPLS